MKHNKLKPGMQVPTFDVVDVHGNRVSTAALRGRKTLVSFHRFSTCPYCNVRVQRLKEAWPTLEAHGLQVVVFFQSPQENLDDHATMGHAPFPVVADPERVVYDRYGVDKSTTGMLTGALGRLPDAMQALKSGWSLALPDGDMTSLPAHFLLDEDGKVHTAHYGRDIGDHLPIDDVIAFAAQSPPSSTTQAVSTRKPA